MDMRGMLQMPYIPVDFKMAEQQNKSASHDKQTVAAVPLHIIHE